MLLHAGCITVGRNGIAIWSNKRDFLVPAVPAAIEEAQASANECELDIGGNLYIFSQCQPT